MKQKGRLGGKAWFIAQAQHDFHHHMTPRTLYGCPAWAVHAYDCTFTHLQLIKQVEMDSLHTQVIGRGRRPKR